MHHLDLGLFHYQIEYTLELLKERGKSLLNKMNQRFALILWHLELKIFTSGLQISRKTASEYRNIMKVMVFVIDDLYDRNLSEIYVKWNEMYLISRQEMFKESDLEIFQVNIFYIFIFVLY